MRLNFLSIATIHGNLSEAASSLHHLGIPALGQAVLVPGDLPAAWHEQGLAV